jgi:dUTP pyrophosphatase
MLNRQEIERLIKEKSLVAGYIDLNTQLTPNGFDLTAAYIHAFTCAGSLDFSNKERSLPPCKEIIPRKKNKQDKFGWWHLKKGIYKVTTNEIVTLPKDMLAISFPRSSLLRMGIFTHTGVWDAGFSGRSEFVLVVENHRGARVKQNARVVQLIFQGINETSHGYQGVYQNKI